MPEGISLWNMKSSLLWVYSGALSPCSDSFAAKQQQESECTAMAESIAFHCWLIAARAHRSKVSRSCYFQLQQKGARGTRHKQKGLSELPWSLSVFLLRFLRQLGSQLVLLIASFTHSSFSVLFSWLLGCSTLGKGGHILTLLIFQCHPSSLSGFHCFRLRVDEVLIFRTLIYVIQIKYASQVTRAPSYS